MAPSSARPRLGSSDGKSSRAGAFTASSTALLGSIAKPAPVHASSAARCAAGTVLAAGRSEAVSGELMTLRKYHTANVLARKLRRVHERKVNARRVGEAPSAGERAEPRTALRRRRAPRCRAAR